VKNYLYILLIEVSFGAIVIEPESQIQNSIYYDSLDEGSYFRIGDEKTSFRQDRLEHRQSYIHFFNIYEWPSDYVIQILNLHKNVVKYDFKDSGQIENYLLRELK